METTRKLTDEELADVFNRLDALSIKHYIRLTEDQFTIIKRARNYDNPVKWPTIAKIMKDTLGIELSCESWRHRYNKELEVRGTQK